MRTQQVGEFNDDDGDERQNGSAQNQLASAPPPLKPTSLDSTQLDSTRLQLGASRRAARAQEVDARPPEVANKLPLVRRRAQRKSAQRIASAGCATRRSRALCVYGDKWAGCCLCGQIVLRPGNDRPSRASRGTAKERDAGRARSPRSPEGRRCGRVARAQSYAVRRTIERRPRTSRRARAYDAQRTTRLARARAPMAEVGSCDAASERADGRKCERKERNERRIQTRR